MNREHQWNLPPKVKGSTLRKLHHKLDPSFIEALDGISKRESERTGRKVSRGTILTDLSTRDSAFHRQKRAELRKLHLQLKKEHTTDASTHNDPKEQERT
jgi:hypothetical protein